MRRAKNFHRREIRCRLGVVCVCVCVCAAGEFEKGSERASAALKRRQGLPSTLIGTRTHTLFFSLSLSLLPTHTPAHTRTNTHTHTAKRRGTTTLNWARGLWVFRSDALEPEERRGLRRGGEGRGHGIGFVLGARVCTRYTAAAEVVAS